MALTHRNTAVPMLNSRTAIRAGNRANALNRVSARHKTMRVDHRFPGGTLLKNMPAFTFIYTALVSPFYTYAIGAAGETRIENIMVWLVMFGATLGVALNKWSLANRSFLRSPPVLALAAYLCFAGASISWALDWQMAMKGYLLQAIIVVMVILPFAFPIPRSYTMQSLHVCCALILAVAAAIVLTSPPSLLGHTGYFPHKQQLGFVAASVVLVSLHELFYPGWRRLLALATGPVAIWLTLESNSKSSLALAIAAPFVAGFLTVLHRYLKIRPSVVLLAITLVVGVAIPDAISRFSYNFNGDYSVTGRIYIWEFINYQISQQPWFGWGFYSYWFLPNSPHLAAPGFIKDMVTSHNGYMELRLYTGYLGYWLFLAFVFLSVRSVDKVHDESPTKACALLSIVIFTLALNLTDSIWLSPSPTWVLYLAVVALSVGAVSSAQPRRASSVGNGLLSSSVSSSPRATADASS